MPVAFLNLDRGEEKREGPSYINPAEAEKTLWALQEVCKGDVLGPDDVGLVTPYKGQVNYIKKLIRERPALQKFRVGLEVESVDGFQGQEKEVIIFCAVRNNREGKVGFLSDWRRLNVMLTRARRGCIVIGSRSTLIADPLWQQWLLWAAAKGAICGESAKGTWVPKYLVDDRDGVWKVKASLIEEATKGVVPANAAPTPRVPKQAAPKEPEILDSWEDMSSPVACPSEARDLLDNVSEAPLEDSAAPDAAAAPEDGAPDAAAAPEETEQEAQAGGDEAPPPPAKAEEAEQEDLAGDDEPPGPPAKADEATMPGSPTTRSVSSPPVRFAGEVSTADADMRSSGTPKTDPKSPSRQLALARLGLVDDLDLE